MNSEDLFKDFIGQDVAVVLQGEMSVTVLGKLEAGNEHFVRIHQRNNRGSILIPINSVLHITEATAVSDDDS
ncbi:MAG: hypothetical protein MPJ50_10855 [Pirellulales bacterium]|nr:hypothetical protein [Pirellulales bacterium]